MSDHPTTRTTKLRTERLTSFLQSERITRLKGGALRRSLRGIWESVKASEPELLFPTELHPARVMAVWRMSRHCYMLKGLLGDDEQLSTAIGEQSPCPWWTPTRPVADSRAARQNRNRAVMEILRRGTPGVVTEDTPIAEARAWQESLAECEKALRMSASLDCREAIPDMLQVDLGSDMDDLKHPRNPDEVDDRVARLARLCPTSDEVEQFEELLVYETLDLLVQHGTRRTINHLMEPDVETGGSGLALTRPEAQRLIRITRGLGEELAGGSVEEHRTLMVARLENMAERCRDSLDYQGEMRAYKEMSRILGLTRSEPNDDMKNLVAIVGRVAESQRKELLTKPKRRRSIDAPEEAVEADFTLLESPAEDEALGAFDREN